MRVLVGHIYHESNTFSPSMTRLEQFELHEGAEMLPLLPGVDVLQAAGIEVIPGLYAARWSSGTVAESAYRTFERKLLNAIRRENGGLDGIFLSLHGGMSVENIGSGEYNLLKSVREAAGEKIPVAISLDMHANNALELAGLVNVMTGYHTAPHTDAAQTQRKAAAALVKLLKSGKTVHPALVRLPMLLVGERAITADEPFKTLYDTCRALEADERILAATVYIGMAWGDTPNTAVSVAVTPADAEYMPFAREQAEKLGAYLYAHREECKYAHPSYMPEEAVTRALASDAAPLYLSDSGDNPTAGGVGDGTVLLELMKRHGSAKKVLFAPVVDAQAYNALSKAMQGSTVNADIGSQRDTYCGKVRLNAQIVRSGEIYARHELSLEKKANYILLRDGNIDVILADAQLAFTGMECFESCKINIPDYDIVVLKMGYMFDEISAPCRGNIMAFTPGCTPLLITGAQYHNLPRPIWPLDRTEG